MIRKNFTDRQTIDFLIARKANALNRDLKAQMLSIAASPKARTFATNTGAFGEFQQGVAVGFCQHYTRRS